MPTWALTWYKVVGDVMVPPLLLDVVSQGSIAHSWSGKSHACQVGVGLLPKAVQQVQGAQQSDGASKRMPYKPPSQCQTPYHMTDKLLPSTVT